MSHALVTHYFGTYAALVEATLERRFHAIRDELVPELLGLVQSQADVKAMLAAHRKVVRRATSDPANVRLFVRALLGGRIAAGDFVPHRMRGLKLLTDVLASRSSALREDLEFLLVVSFVSRRSGPWASARSRAPWARGRRASSRKDSSAASTS